MSLYGRICRRYIGLLKLSLFLQNLLRLKFKSMWQLRIDWFPDTQFWRMQMYGQLCRIRVNLPTLPLQLSEMLGFKFERMHRLRSLQNENFGSKYLRMHRRIRRKHYYKLVWIVSQYLQNLYRFGRQPMHRLWFKWQSNNWQYNLHMQRRICRKHFKGLRNLSHKLPDLLWFTE